MLTLCRCYHPHNSAKTLTPREVRCFLPLAELEGDGICTQAWVIREHSVLQAAHAEAGRAYSEKRVEAGAGQEKPSSALPSH